MWSENKARSTFSRPEDMDSLVQPSNTVLHVVPWYLQTALDKNYHVRMLELQKAVNPEEDVVGW